MAEQQAHGFNGFAAAPGVMDVDGQGTGAQHVHPFGAARDRDAGFIHVHHVGLAHGLADGLLHRRWLGEGGRLGARQCAFRQADPK